MINEDVRQIIEAELQPEEELLWADKPYKRPVTGYGAFVGVVYILILLFCPVFMLVVMFEGGFGFTAAKLAGLAFILMFFLIGVSMSHQPLKHLLGPAHEVYGLTDKRGIIISPYWRLEKSTITPDEMQKVRLFSNNGDMGTIQFDQVTARFFVIPFSQEYWKTAELWRVSNLGSFHNIRNPRKVFDLIARNFKETS